MVREQIKQVLINLIDNAIKYTAEGGKVEVKVKQEKDKIYFLFKIMVWEFLKLIKREFLKDFIELIKLGQGLWEEQELDYRL